VPKTTTRIRDIWYREIDRDLYIYIMRIHRDRKGFADIDDRPLYIYYIKSSGLRGVSSVLSALQLGALLFRCHSRTRMDRRQWKIILRYFRILRLGDRESVEVFRGRVFG